MYQLDQSGKIEYTSKPTVIAYANGKAKSIRISAQEKRKLEKIFRLADKPNVFIYRTFAILIFLLIKKDLANLPIIYLDREYKGKEDLIKKYLVEVIRQSGCIDIPIIHFTEIGKISHAHKLAISVYRGKLKPDIIVKSNDITKWII